MPVLHQFSPEPPKTQPDPVSSRVLAPAQSMLDATEPVSSSSRAPFLPAPPGSAPARGMSTERRTPELRPALPSMERREATTATSSSSSTPPGGQQRGAGEEEGHTGKRLELPYSSAS
ncbi:hypothetical protein TSOC_009265 [Tetrabaena socialis]|uniref:Uncharacterized protein n=1 Tax=Tetrabaena socialis TaxID=47790 RepID=A0A2J7ZWB2_9CHLO|nr:hypothetical protein TSOC_009265 [Tetrabaena socialis]|eukprot:PNH04567.1 hypothetical protein TSOC_009265 [Tetrabaena socialis]